MRRDTLVGWSVEDVEVQGADVTYFDYNMIGEKGTPVARICHARGRNANLPSVWLMHLLVGDLAESLHRVEEEGGQVVQARNDAGGSAVQAVIKDPVGVYLALVQA